MKELEELIRKLSFEPFSDNIEENFDRGLILAYLEELRQWRKNPFLMLKKHCESIPKCEECEYDDLGCGRSRSPVPEEWKV